MLFANAHIKSTVGHFIHHELERRTRRHGGCNAKDLIVLFGQFNKGMSKYILVFGWLRRFVFLFINFTGDLVKQTGRMPQGLFFFGPGIALSFYGEYVQ